MSSDPAQSTTNPMASPTKTISDWADRRGMFQKGKEVHEPGRRMSQSSTGGGSVADALRRVSVGSADLEKTTSNTSQGGGSPTQRRRPSNSGGLFGNLTQHKRGTEDYADRRASHSDQSAAPTGFLSGWYSSTFKGMAANNKPTEDKTQDAKKRGVME